MTRCPACGCGDSDGVRAHALVEAVRGDDIDRALELGLLDPSMTCFGCSDACRAMLETARKQRTNALEARERFRTRNARLQRRQQERDERRKQVGQATAAPAAATAASSPALPPAAAAALARAKARAAERSPR